MMSLKCRYMRILTNKHVAMQHEETKMGLNLDKDGGWEYEKL